MRKVMASLAESAFYYTLFSMKLMVLEGNKEGETPWGLQCVGCCARMARDFPFSRRGVECGGGRLHAMMSVWGRCGAAPTDAAAELWRCSLCEGSSL